MRNVPFTGIEWAFMLNDEGFSQNGVKYLTDMEMSALSQQEHEDD